jgi:hypothetical protein
MAETAIFSISKKKKVCEEVVERPRLAGEKMMACQLLLFCLLHTLFYFVTKMICRDTCCITS